MSARRAIVIDCDSCESWCLLPRVALLPARDYAAGQLGWRCDERGDYCPKCAEAQP